MTQGPNLLKTLHGKVINYSDIKHLPKRDSFLEPTRKSAINKIIENNETLSFMPASIAEKNLPGDYSYKYSKWRFKLILFGVFTDGRSATVVINNIDPYTYVRIPDEYQQKTSLRYLFKSKVEKIMNVNSFDYDELEMVHKREFMGFNKKAYFIKITFSKTGSFSSRNKAINLFRNEYNWKTATDDKTGYYKVPIRDGKLTISSWLKLNKYTVDSSNIYLKDKVVFHVNLEDIEPYTSDEILNNPLLAYDHSLAMGWDIECMSKSGDLTVPENDDDTLFMICVSFQWYFAKTQLLRVCLVDVPTKSHPDFLTVVCGNEKKIIKAFSWMFKLMTPEYVMGFNDSGFDWPWVVSRAWKYSVQDGPNIGKGVMEFMANKMDRIITKHCYKNKKYKSWLKKEKKEKEKEEKGKFKKKYANEKLKTPYNAYLAHIISNYKKEERIKIDASTYTDAYFLQYNGYIVFDVRIIFRQLYPTEEQSSLNHYLGLNKLKSKEDMSIQRMFQIYRDMLILINKGKPMKGPKFEQLTMDMRDVANYCVIDAQRCLELTRIRNVIPDRREVSNLTYVSVYDAFYRAGGMKMRNLVIAEGQDRDYVFSNISQEKKNKDKNKYPGALVLNPKTGLICPKLTLKERMEKHKEFIEKFGYEFDEPYSLRDIPHSDLASLEDVGSKIDALNKAIIDSNSSGVGLTEDETNEVLEKADLKGNDIFKSYLMEKTGRPVTGLDFASLYPHLIMTYNMSPEYMICMTTCNNSIEQMVMESEEVEKQGYSLHGIKFQYGGCSITGYSVRHDNLINIENPTIENNKFGIYPSVLKKLYNKRSIMKKPAHYYEMLIEHFNKLNDNIEKNNRIVKFINTYPDVYDEVTNWDDLIERDDAFEYVKNKFDKDEVRDFQKQEPFTEFKMNYAVEFIKKKTNVDEKKVHKILNYNNDVIDIDNMERLFAYYSSKQLSVKIMLNTLYGESGHKNSPFYMLELAGGITTAGRYNLRLIKDICLEEGCYVVYGDSVVGDTPVLIENNKYVNIEDLFNEKDYIEELDKEVHFPDDKYVWTDKGFTKIKKVIRHRTKKKLYRILTHVGCVDVTEDHSLLNKDGKKIKPSECEVGTELLHRDLPFQEPEIKEDVISKEEAWAYGLFMADGSCGTYYSKKYGYKYSWAINNQNKDYLNKAAEGMKNSVYCQKFKILETMKSSGVYKLVPAGNGYGKNSHMVKEFRKIFYYNKTKIVPTIILKSSYEIRKSYFEGYYAGDGSKTDKSKQFAAKGKIGAATLYKLCNSLGYNCSINSNIYKPDIYWLTLGHKFYKHPNKIKKIIPLGEVNQYVYDLETENHHFSAGVGKMVISNTDSVYISIPERHFHNLDKTYFGGRMSKIEYCNKLVDKTFEQIKIINKLANDKLVEDNGTEFLKLNYEEVLYPIVMLSKKKYYGLPHISVANFNVDRKPFVKGIESKKRGTAEILKKVYDTQIMRESLSIENKLELMELMYRAVHYFYETKWVIEDFVKTAIYKPKSFEEIEEGKGNKAVLLFADRMDKRGIEITPYERFKYIIVKKHLNSYDYRGRKSDLKVGERMELLENVKKYNMDIDKDYYMKGGILSQLARVMIYRKDFYVASKDDTDEEIKKANDKMVEKAKKHIQKFINHKEFYDIYHNVGPIKQRIFREAENIFISTFMDTIVSNTKQSKLFNKQTMSIIFNRDKDINKSFAAFVGKIEKIAIKNSANYGDNLINMMRKKCYEKKKTKKDIIDILMKLYGSPDSKYIKLCTIIKNKHMKETENKFGEIFTTFPKISDKYIDVIKTMSNIIDSTVGSVYSQYYDPFKGDDGFKVISKLNTKDLEAKSNRKIPYDVLRDIANSKVSELENDYDMKNIIKKIINLQSEIYLILLIYCQTKNISDTITIHIDKKTGVQLSLYKDYHILNDHKKELIDETCLDIHDIDL